MVKSRALAWNMFLFGLVLILAIFSLKYYKKENVNFNDWEIIKTDFDAEVSLYNIKRWSNSILSLQRELGSESGTLVNNSGFGVKKVYPRQVFIEDIWTVCDNLRWRIKLHNEEIGDNSRLIQYYFEIDSEIDNICKKYNH